MTSRSYRELTCPALVEWYIAVHPDAFVNKGRDAHLLRVFMVDRGVTPTQVLEGMLFANYCMSIPSLISSVDDWLMDDVLEQEASLAAALSPVAPPSCLYTYRDLKDTGIESTQQEQAWQEARQELEQYVETVLNVPALSPRHPKIRRLLSA